MGAEKHPDDEARLQSRDNAAQHVSADESNAGTERYPPTQKDDSIETPGQAGEARSESRSFEDNVEAADSEARTREPDPSVNQGRMGPGAEPAEGKR